MISTIHLFDGYGVELEYMIVDKDSLAVKPIADKIIYDVTGEFASDVEFDETAWSNELVLHVIEIKTNGPRKELSNLDTVFHKNIKHINNILLKYNCMLLPTGMHPFMDPLKETFLWPHEYNATYETYNKIFNCRGHGWSNLQSLHLNLPFADDDEFKKLHAAVRLLLPIIPAVSASTPLIDGKLSGYLDNRLEVYRKNQVKIPSIAGEIIPEKVFNKRDYENVILNKIYSDLFPFDSEGILHNEWVNSRGAIARFERNTVEIRIIDIQECPSADMAVVYAVVNILKFLITGKWIKLEKQIEWDAERLSQIFLNVVKEGENSIINDEEYLNVFKYKEKKNCIAGDLWRYLIGEISGNFDSRNQPWLDNIKTILRHGSLSSRMIRFLNNDYSHNNIIKAYNYLSACLADNKMFVP